MSYLHQAIRNTRPKKKRSKKTPHKSDSIENLSEGEIEFTLPKDELELSDELTPVVRAAVSEDSESSERFRLLRIKLRGVAGEDPVGCVGMVSAVAGEGKTTTSLGLAFAGSREVNRSVLLIEGDMRRPSFEKVFGLPQHDGLGEWLQGTCKDVPVRKFRNGPYVITAGNMSVPPVERLASNQMAELLDNARRVFDFVVVDCPPLAPVADSVILQDFLDGVLFVVRTRWASRDVIRNAYASLKPERVLGTILNDYAEIVQRYELRNYKYYGDPHQ